MFYVYILLSKGGKIYIGYSEDLKERFKRHNNGEVKSTKPYRPWKLIFYESYISKMDAKRREMYLKTSKGWTTIKTMLKETLRS